MNDWGWTPIYRGDYSDTVSIPTVFSGAQQYLMIAGIQDGSLTIDVLGAALTSDILTYTSYNETHTANDVNWYYNGYSMGFAGLGDTINQSSADINGSDWSPPSERDRLSWHTFGPLYSDGAPTEINGGWRSGDNIFLNQSTDWDRVVFTSNGPSAVPTPEPSTWAMMLLSFGFMAFYMRRKKATFAPVSFS